MENVGNYYLWLSIGGLVFGIILQFISLPLLLKFFEIERAILMVLGRVKQTEIVVEIIRLKKFILLLESLKIIIIKNFFRSLNKTRK